jgi:hypothetical protein
MLDPAHAAAVVEAVDRLERAPDVSDLARVVAGP